MLKKFLYKYKELLIFLLITLIIFIFGIFKHKNNIWTFFESFDTATAIALAILALMAYNEYAKGEDEIELKVAVYDDVKSNNFKIKDFTEIAGNKVKVLRKEVNRSEIMGILGMFQRDMKTRFEMKDNKLKILFLNNLKQIQKGKGDALIIPILKEDYENFLNPKTLEKNDN